MTAAPTCWVISDGRRGIENQALGLAEAMAAQKSLSITTETIQNGKLFEKLPAWTQFRLRKDPSSYFDSFEWPDIAIGCGRQAIAPMLALKRHLKNNIFTVYVQHPRLDPSYFDAVIAPEHDKLAGPNVFSIIGSPNRVTPERLNLAKEVIPISKRKVATFLIGGNSKTHKLTPTCFAQWMELMEGLKLDGWNIWITTSRRTPNFALEALTSFASEDDAVKLYSGEGDNPYFAYLYHADMIFVTEDSTNMLTEACATGKPVFRLPMNGNPGKFQMLYDALEKRCRVRPAIGSDLAPQAYSPLHETTRAAQYLWTEFDKKPHALA